MQFLTFVAGAKSSVHAHLNYLIIITPPFIPSASSASATVRNFVAAASLSRTNSANTDSNITKVTVFDLENKLVAYSGAFVEGVREVVSQWGKVYVLGSDGTVSSPFSFDPHLRLFFFDIVYRCHV
jgi:vacuolar protein sorting-associated protein 11